MRNLVLGESKKYKNCVAKKCQTNNLVSNGKNNYYHIYVYIIYFLICFYDYWRASVASETLTGVTQSKIGDVYLFIYLFVYMYGRMYVILYFDPRVFVLVRLSTPSQIALNRVLW